MRFIVLCLLLVGCATKPKAGATGGACPPERMACFTEAMNPPRTTCTCRPVLCVDGDAIVPCRE